MSPYVMGEMIIGLALAALAGMVIGWCIKSLFTGRTEQKVREHVARDVDEAAADVQQMQSALQKKETELRELTVELQQLRGRDASLKAGNSTQIQEINALKQELSESRQSLDRNRAEFNAFRNEKQTETQALTSKLSSFQAGGPVYDERIKEANETITALRTAVQENDKIIDSLRARVKEGDQSVENLRNQLKTAESTTREIQAAENTRNAELAALNTSLQEASAQRDNFKRDYDQTLESKNAEIARQQARLEELGSVQSLLQQKEHALNKLTEDSRNLGNRSNTQITELKKTIADRDGAQAQAQKELKKQLEEINSLQANLKATTTRHDKQMVMLNDKLAATKTDLLAKNKATIARHEKQMAELQAKLDDTRRQLQAANDTVESTRSVQQEIETKNAEVSALNDLLRDVSGKRDTLQTRITTLEQQLGAARVNEAAASEAQHQLKAMESTVEERDALFAKLLGDMDAVVAKRNSLSTELGELQTANSKLEETVTADAERKLASLNEEMRERDSNIEKLRTDMAQIVTSRDALAAEVTRLKTRAAELETFKTQAKATVDTRTTELSQRNAAYEKLQNEFRQLTSTRDEYEKRLTHLSARVEEQSRAGETEIAQLKSQVADLRQQLTVAQSDNQRLSEELSSAEGLKLKITERESEIKKLTISSRDAGTADSLKSALEEQSKKTSTLTSALQERDAEISRLSAIVTDNRVGSKQHASENALLKQELESQQKLISSLEEQAESTLVLHKKIASQSAEIEELQATLYQSNSIDNKTRPAQSDTTDRSVKLNALEKQLADKDAELQRVKSQAVGLQQLQTQNEELKRAVNARNRELQQTRLELAGIAATAGTDNRASTTNKGDALTAAQVSKAKPRVFVRPDSPATGNLTGTDSVHQRRAQYTRDGYKLTDADGRDDLTLLPGIDKSKAVVLQQAGITEFEKIALWGQREVVHFADRLNVSSKQADSYNWPHCARQMLDGSFRRDTRLEDA